MEADDDNYQSLSVKGHKYYSAESLGEGTFGSVRTCYNEEGLQFALKEFQLELVDSDDSDYDSDDSHYECLQLGTLREISILRLFSPLFESEKDSVVQGKDYYVISLEDITRISGATCMIMPKHMCSLKKAISSNLLNNKQKLNITHKLLVAVAFLHENSIIHRDIKTDNILLDEELNPVLADFSLSKIFDKSLSGSTHTPGLGTATYKSPEIYYEQKYDLSSDVFSLGIVLFELFNGIIQLDRDKAALNYLETTITKLGDKPLPSLLKKMLNFKKRTRITCKEALQLPLFEKFENPKIIKTHYKIVNARNQEIESPNPNISTDAPSIGILNNPPPQKLQKRKKNSGARKQKKESKTFNTDAEELFSLLEYKNPLTLQAAKIYQEKSSEPIMYCLILAGKFYEEELLSVGIIKSYLDDFDVQEYSKSEMKIFQSMQFCLYI